MTKEAELAGIEHLSQELSSATQAITETKTVLESQYRELANNFNGVKNSNDEVRQKLEEQAGQYAETSAKLQALEEGQKETQRFLDSPVFGTEKDLADHDRKVAIEAQRRAFLYKGNDPEDFKPDMANLINPVDYRSAVRKLMRVGVEKKEKIISSFTDSEKRAFDAASLGSAFFAPEFLGLEVDCNTECGYLLDLYAQMDVSRSSFSYLHINDYGALGEYTCDAVCDAPMGPEGNITAEVGKTYDFRGVFCLQNKVVKEADYAILPFMIRAANRSYRINRNRATMIGDGTNEPLGWANGAGKFPVRNTSAPNTLTAQDVRLFLNSIPREYGNVTAVMHQNVFAMIASLVDENGRFLFGDGDVLFSPEKVSEFIRVSNCLPDPTKGLTVSNKEIMSGDFIMAAANWKTAYHAVNKTPLFFEQWEGQSSAWCVKYQFGAEDGGFIGCPDAGRILKAA